MNVDPQAHPLSPDGQWAWSGKEWVPAGVYYPVAEPEPEPEPPPAPEPVFTPTLPEPPVFTRLVPTDPEPTTDPQPVVIASHEKPYVPAPAPIARQRRSTKGVLIFVLVAFVVFAIVLVIVTRSGSKSGLSGAFTCTSPGAKGAGTLTFGKNDTYALSGGTGGSYTRTGSALTFVSGGLNAGTGYVNSNEVAITFDGRTLICKK